MNPHPFRQMADSIFASNLPTAVDFWGMYLNGKWPTYYHRLPPTEIRPIRISINAATFADVYDVESGDLRPQDVPAALHTNPNATIYASTESGWPFVVQICKAAHIPIPPWWAAAPGYKGLYPGSIATQNRQVGGCDISDVADYWPGIDPLPTITEDGTVFLRRDMQTDRVYLQTGDGRLYWIPDQTPDLQNLVKQHGPSQDYTPAFLQQFQGYIPAAKS